MSDEEFRSFEKTALAFLRTLDFTPVGYYPYPHGSDVSGYIKAVPPFRVPVKAMAEIVRATPTRALIEGFHKIAKNSLAERVILICQTPLSDLPPDLRSLIERLNIDFFDNTTISEELVRKKVSKSDVLNYSKLYDIVAAPLLAEALPDVSRQKIPENMKEYTERLGLKSWQVLEQTVFSILHYCFSLVVRKYGEDYLFEHEPEGVAIVGDVSSFAFIYECKSAAETYIMTAQDQLTYIDYIRKEKEKVKVLERSELKYFVIIAPDFLGDLQARRENIFKETQVIVVFLRAEILRQLSKWACSLPSNLKRLVDFRDIFKLEEVVVSEDSVGAYIKKFEEENRSRW